MGPDRSTAIRLPLGVRDFLPQAAARRRALTDSLMGEFERWGFERIITPLFECADVLERGLGDDARAAAIRFVEPKTGEVVALRPDITPQAARLVVTRMGEIRGPIRLCYEGRVARMSAGARGQREILQAGIELYGAPAPDGDVEAVCLAASALAATGMPGARLEVGHVALTRYVLGQVQDSRQHRDMELALRKKDRGALESIVSSLPAKTREIACALPGLFGDPRQVFKRLEALAVPVACRRGMQELAHVVEACGKVVESALGAGLSIDLGEVRGFEYYTGLRLAGYAPGAGDAVLLGGRYDELVARYGRDLSAVGFAVDIEAVAEAQTAAGQPGPPVARSVLVIANKLRRKEAQAVAKGLRTGGLRAAVDQGRSRSRAENLNYSQRTGFTCVLELSASSSIWYEGAAVETISASALRKLSRGDIRPVQRIMD